jgi:hypothetical protein
MRRRSLYPTRSRVSQNRGAQHAQQMWAARAAVDGLAAGGAFRASRVDQRPCGFLPIEIRDAIAQHEPDVRIEISIGRSLCG